MSDRELEQKLNGKGYTVMRDHDTQSYKLERRRTGATTSLDATDYSGALAEAWDLVKDGGDQGETAGVPA